MNSANRGGVLPAKPAFGTPGGSWFIFHSVLQRLWMLVLTLSRPGETWELFRKRRTKLYQKVKVNTREVLSHLWCWQWPTQALSSLQLWEGTISCCPSAVLGDRDRLWNMLLQEDWLLRDGVCDAFSLSWETSANSLTSEQIQSLMSALWGSSQANFWPWRVLVLTRT